jgi:hypothetical protein
MNDLCKPEYGFIKPIVEAMDEDENPLVAGLRCSGDR